MNQAPTQLCFVLVIFKSISREFLGLDHVSYVTSYDQLADTVQRLGSRNFTLPLHNGQYIDVVCPLDHPAINGKVIAKVVKVEIAEVLVRLEEWL